MRRFAQHQGKGTIPVLLMCSCRLSILWKVEVRSPGGHLPMNEKSISPNKIKGDKENEIRIYNHLCFIGRGNLKEERWFQNNLGVKKSSQYASVRNVSSRLMYFNEI